MPSVSMIRATVSVTDFCFRHAFPLYARCYDLYKARTDREIEIGLDGGLDRREAGFCFDRAAVFEGHGKHSGQWSFPLPVPESICHPVAEPAACAPCYHG